VRVSGLCVRHAGQAAMRAATKFPRSRRDRLSPAPRPASSSRRPSQLSFVDSTALRCGCYIIPRMGLSPTRSLRRSAPRDDKKEVVIASAAKQSRRVVFHVKPSTARRQLYSFQGRRDGRRKAGPQRDPGFLIGAHVLLLEYLA
jgi:hypothetical protein